MTDKREKERSQGRGCKIGEKQEKGGVVQMKNGKMVSNQPATRVPD